MQKLKKLKNPNAELEQMKRKLSEISKKETTESKSKETTRQTPEMENNKLNTKMIIGIKCNRLWERNKTIIIHIRNGHIDRIQEENGIWLKM